MNIRDKKFLMEAIRQMLIEASLNSVYKKQYSKKMSYEDYMTICNIDPTTNGDNMGKYCLWLLRELQKEAQRMDKDIHEFVQEYYMEGEPSAQYLTDKLSFYEKNKGKIKSQYPEYADITKLDISQFSLFVNEKRDEFENKQLEKFKSNDAECVYNDKDWQIIIPYTWEASKKYGANTRWCTTDKYDDYFFKKYSKTEPLFINIDKRNNVKYQFSIKQRCFFNAADDPIARDIYGAAEKTDMPKNVLKFYEHEVNGIIEAYKERKGDTKYTKSAYDLAYEYYEEKVDLPTIFSDPKSHERIFDLGKNFLNVLSVCAVIRRENNANITFRLYNYDEDESRTIDNFGNGLDEDTLYALEKVHIMLYDCAIDINFIRDYTENTLLYFNLENHERTLICIEDDDCEPISLTQGKTWNVDMFLDKMSNGCSQAVLKYLPSEFIDEYTMRHFDASNAIKVFEGMYVYNGLLCAYDGKNLTNILKDVDVSQIEHNDNIVDEIYYANQENGIIIFKNMGGRYSLVVNGLDEENSDDAMGFYDDEKYYDDEFVNSWLLYCTLDREPEIYENDKTSNIAFNADSFSFFSINNEHYTFAQIVEDFNEEVFVLTDGNVISIYCGKIDEHADEINLDSGDRIVYISHEDEGGSYVRGIDIFSGEEVNRNNPSDADNFYQSDPEDEYSYHMAENVKKKFNNLFERINKNYNPNRFIE